MFFSTEGPCRSQESDPEQGILVELDRPDRALKAQGPREDAVADGKCHEKEEETRQHRHARQYFVQEPAQCFESQIRFRITHA